MAEPPADVSGLHFVPDFADGFARAFPPALVDSVNGGSGDDATLIRNRTAFSRWLLRPRALAGAASPELAVDLLGTRLEVPFFVAPTGSHRQLHRDGEAATAAAAAAAGTLFVRSALADCPSAEVAAAGGVRWQQLNMLRDRRLMSAAAAEAERDGYAAICLTVDSPVRARRRFDPVSLGAAPPASPHADIDPAFSWRDVERFREECPLPLVLKGITDPEDAIRALDAGAAAVYVSNHGGRQLNGAPASLESLAAVVGAVRGQAPVLFDGGCRCGADVVTALALGASAVGLGRAPLWGLALAGAAGAARVLEIVRAEVRETLTMTGSASVAELGPRTLIDAAEYEVRAY